MKLSEFIEAAGYLREEFGDLEVKCFINGVYLPASMHLASCSEAGEYVRRIADTGMIGVLRIDDESLQEAYKRRRELRGKS